MEETRGRKKVEEAAVAPGEPSCDAERVLKAMGFLETGVRQAFLDGEFGVEDTKDILSRIAEARKRCEAGDITVCSALDELVARLPQEAAEER